MAEETADVARKERRKKTDTKKKSPFRSMMFQTWLYFFLLASLLLIVLWAFQMFFYQSTYRRMMTQEVERTGDKVARSYPGQAGNVEYAGYLQQTAHENGMNIIVFHMDDSDRVSGCYAEDLRFEAEYISSRFNAGDLPDKGLITITDPRIIDGWEEYYAKLHKQDRCIFEYKNNRGTYMCYGARLNGEGSYLYMSTPISMLKSTMFLMRNQLLISSLLCLVISLVLAYFISRRITKPIAEFSRVAKRVGEGDYTAKFAGNGYNEIDDLAETLNATTEEFAKTEQMRRDFLANVGHDLRTPLTMVKAYAELIRDISGGDEEKRTRHSQIIIDESDRLTALVADILDLSKLQSGTENLQTSHIDVGALVSTVIERFDVYATKQGYTFIAQTEDNCVAVCDRNRIEQVLYNLVGNAVTHAGEKQTVLLSVRREGGKIRVGVRDYGKGIPPEELDKVWDRYYRAGQSKRNRIGSGLGLSIVRGILEAHGAAYGVDSTLGEGTEFWFMLDVPESAKK